MKYLHKIILIIVLGNIALFALLKGWQYVSPTISLNAAQSKEIIFLALGGFLLVYYIITWLATGKDPAKVPLKTVAAPPQGLSPAMAYYIYTPQNIYYSKLCSLILAQASMKGYIDIIFDDKTTFKIKTTANFRDIKDMNNMEKEALNLLITGAEGSNFSAGDVFTFDTKHGGNMRNRHILIYKMFQKSMEPFYKNNDKFKAIGNLVIIILLVAAIVLQSPKILLMLTVVYIAQIIYVKTIDRYTKEGAIIKSELEGFKKFLKETKEPLQAENFALCFPYSIALGVSYYWVNKEKLAEQNTAASASWEHYKKHADVFTNTQNGTDAVYEALSKMIALPNN
ncbi:hypothetical protein Dip510_000742 [Elusimicrobium posterum]|uniref:DUF2207 family protein n=1 Tax=Elusimicrobium posterum TaxID=3116653 RepID=UPI003C78C9C8